MKNDYKEDLGKAQEKTFEEEKKKSNERNKKKKKKHTKNVHKDTKQPVNYDTSGSINDLFHNQKSLGDNEKI